jgi:hypothetical protein
MSRINSSVSASEFACRLAAIKLDQSKFARRSGLSWHQVHRYCSGKVALPASVDRLLKCEELIYGLNALIVKAGTHGDRIGKRMIVALVRAASAPLPEGKPKHQAKHRKRKKNLLAPRYLPPPPPADELEKPETWTVLAQRIGQDEAQRLHQRLMQRRPRGPGGRAGDGEAPIARVSDPI